MASYASAEEIHRLRLLRGNNYQGGYQPQWVRLTADTIQAIDAKSEKTAEVPVTRERSESIKSEDSSTSSSAASTEHVEFKGLRML